MDIKIENGKIILARIILNILLMLTESILVRQ